MNDRTVQWLLKAKGSLLEIKDNFGVAMDDFRLHIFDATLLPEDLSVLNPKGIHSIKSIVEKFFNDTLAITFKIDSQFLVDALYDFNGEIKIQVYQEGGRARGVHIKQGKREAFVMCIEDTDND